MAKETELVRIEKGNVDAVRRAIIGTNYNLGTYYAMASQYMQAAPTKITEEELAEKIDSNMNVLAIIEIFKTYRL